MKSFIATALMPFFKYQVKQIEASAYHPLRNQEKILQHIIAVCSNTEIGKAQGLNKIKNLQEAKQLQPSNYETIQPLVNKIYQHGKSAKGIMSWSPLDGFALTSGTTGGVKYFPITQESLRVFQKSAFSLYAAAVYQAKQPAQLLFGRGLTLAAAPFKENSPTGLPVGYMSGYLLVKTHPLIRRLIYPSDKVANIAAWQEKIVQIFKETQHANIAYIAGFPAAIKLFTEAALNYFKVKTLQEIWPHLQYCVYGGNFLFEEDRQAITELWAGKTQQEIVFYENYSAVEGFFGQTLYQDWPGLVFNTKYNFYQFKETNNHEFLQLHELEENKEYHIYISNTNGLINYAMGDIIKITSVKPLTFKFVTRDNDYLCLIAERIILEEIQTAIAAFAQQYHLSIHDFVVWAEAGHPNQLAVGLALDKDREFTNEELLFLNNALRANNFCYDDYCKDNIYGLLRIEKFPKTLFDHYRARNIHKGNFKEKRLFNSKAAFEKAYL